MAPGGVEVEAPAEVGQLGAVGRVDGAGTPSGGGDEQAQVRDLVDGDGAQHRLRDRGAGDRHTVPAQQRRGMAAEAVGDLVAQCVAGHQHRAGVHGDAARHQRGARDVVGAHERLERQARQVGGDRAPGVGVHDAPDVGAPPQDPGVEGELVWNGPAVQLAGQAGLAVEGHHPHILGRGVGQPRLPGASAAHQDPLVVEAEADVAEEPRRQVAAR